MSQSSSSSCKSPEFDRRRSAHLGLRPKSWDMRQRKSKYQLQQNYLEQWCISSTESLTKSEDEDIQSSTMMSTSALQPETNSNLPDYTLLAAKFGINVSTVEKHHSILTSNPQVPIIRAVSIKAELQSPEKFTQSFEVSPVFGTKKKVRKPKFKVVPKLATEKNEPIKINKRVSQNIEQFLETLEAVKIKEEIVSPNDSQSEEFFVNNNSQSESSQPNPKYKRWKELVDSSGDEFEYSKKSAAMTKKNSAMVMSPSGELSTAIVMNPLAEKSTALVTNPFSKNNCGPPKTSLQNSKKKKLSFWSKKFGNNDPLQRRRKFIETFEKKKLTSEESDFSDDELAGLSHKSTSDSRNGKDDLKKIHKSIKSRNRNKKKAKQSKDKKSSSVSTAANSCINSLSVNYQQNFNLTKVKIENTTSVSNSQNTIPLSFGSGISDHETSASEENYNAKNDVDDSRKTANFSNEKSEPNNINRDKDNESNNVERNKDRNNLNDIFLDLFDSPTKLDMDSPPRSTLIKSSTPSPTKEYLIKEINKPKVKPIIISDNKLPNNTIVFSGLKKDPKQLKSNELIKSPNNDTDQMESSSYSDSIKISATQSNGINEKAENMINEALSSQPEFNGAVKKVVDISDTRPIAESPKTLRSTKPPPKMNLARQVKMISTGGNSFEEDFDSLCKDVCKLSSHENITLYRGDQPQEPKEADQSLRMSDVSHKTDLPLPPVERSLNKSPVICQSNRRHRLSLKSPTSAPNNAGPPNIMNRLQRRGHPQWPRNLKNQISFPNNSNLLSSPNISEDPRLNRSLSPVKSLSERDPRLNRSVSPAKSMGLSERDPRLNKSYSPLTTKTSPITDPRLLRGKSQPRQSDVPSQPSGEINNSSNIIDPRLRKRKERQEAESSAKISEVNETDKKNEDDTIFSVPQEGACSKRRKISVFQRLGGMSNTSSPDKKLKEERNEIFNIVKSKTLMHDSDDDISLHPGELFSDEEDLDASPPHRKFISERSGIEGAKTEDVRQHLNQPTSVRDRLGGNRNLINANRRPAPLTSMLMAPIPAKPISVKDRITPNANIIAQRRTQQDIQPLMAKAVPTSILGLMDTSLSEYGNNNVAFNDDFYKMNAAQMLKDEDNLKTQELDNESYVVFGADTVEKSTKFDHVSILDGPSEPVQVGMTENKTNFFRNYCFKTLRKGKCPFEQINCNFIHNVEFLQQKIRTKRIVLLNPILDFAIQNNFLYFIESTWTSMLPILQNEAFNVFEKLYQANIRSEKILKEFLEYCLSVKLVGLESVESFLKRVSPIVEKGDHETVRIICAAIKGKVRDGFCWETIKDLSQKAVPPRDMIELTLIQCLKRKKNQSHINEVYDLVKNRMSVIERSKMSQPMLKQFFNLVQSKDITSGKEVPNTLPLTNTTSKISKINTVKLISKITTPSRRESRGNSSDSLISSENEKLTKPVQLTTASLKNRRSSQQESNSAVSSTFSIPQPNDSPLESRITPDKGESQNFSEYAVSDIEASEAESSFRDRFWKLYIAVHQVKEGLKHVDYEYVWKVLDEFSREDIQDELLKRAYYHILCKNVRNCERHVTGIIKQAVRCGWSISRKSVDMLFETGVCALIDLADNDLWVMAFQLLNWVKVLEPDEPRTTFVLISAEIYLANNDPLEALYLLQRTRLIRTNRDEWLTKDSTRDHEKHRNKLVFILLQALTFEDPEKAVYLFKTLMADQYIFHFPIDLPLYLDKFTLLLLLQNEEELAADICRIVMDNDLSFQRATYKELLSQLVSVDEVLANQILDYAIHLGYINDVQIKHGFTTVIIDMNSSEEELYLMLKRLIHKLVLSIGPVIQHLKPNQLKVILIFEDIPAEKRLYRDNFAVMRKDTYKSIRTLVNTMLATRFTPPIRISRGKANKFCKIMSRSLVDYLKHWN